MEVVYRRCAGIDIAKKSAKVCVWTAAHGRGKPQQQVTSWGSTTARILALRDYLIQAQVECVVMEATGDYWRPFYYVLEGAGFEVMLVNARQVKNVPGRKTDVLDAVWLAELGAHGLVRASFVPPPPIRKLRDLTRTRTVLGRERVREGQRLEKLLEDAGVKLTSVVSTVLGVSSVRMMRAMAAGERDPAALAQLADWRLRATAAELIEALTGRFTDHHGFLVKIHLDVIERLDEAIARITDRIEEAMKPFRRQRELIVSVPGISVLVADVVIAETGGDMSVFPTADHLASWAGVAPGLNESAGISKSATTGHGNPYLKGGLGIAAMSVARSKNTYFSAKYSRIAQRRGPSRAIVAIERSMLTAIWHMLTNDTPYQDPGPDYYLHRRPEQVKNRALRQLADLGYQVTLQRTG